MNSPTPGPGDAPRLPAHHRAHPRARTWTFATLDRGAAYRLWFDHDVQRWEVTDLDGDGSPDRSRVLAHRLAPWEQPPSEHASAGPRAGICDGDQR